MRRFLILTIVSLIGAVAYADPSTDAQNQAQPGAGSGSGEIAPPAPDAPPAKVQEAKNIAKTADLTPIVPNPSNPTKPAYLLYAELDPPILATGLVFIYGRSYKVTSVYCAPLCDQNGGTYSAGGTSSTGTYPALNPIDKVTAGYYSSGWSLASDIGIYSLAGAAAVTMVADEGFLYALNDGVVVGEATLSAAALGSIMTLAAGRPRPFMYSEKAPVALRESGNGGLSFISSHTSESFALATSLFVTEHRRHPNAKWPYYVLGGGLGVASFVATARVMSGYHFITDVLGGAIVGSSVGVLITSVHKSPVKVIPVTNHDAAGNLSGAGLGIAGDF